MTRKKIEISQSALEFALVLPILLIIILGMIEMGHLIFVYGSVLNATREAARFGAATGTISGIKQYQDCAGITQAALNLRFLANFTQANINIMYDQGPGTTEFGPCNSLSTSQWDSIGTGSRIKVTITSPFTLLVPLIPIQPFDIVSTSSRTILGSVAIAGTVVAPPAGPPPGATPTFTPTTTQTPTNTATATATATDTPTLVNSPTPTITPTTTLTPTITLTPTLTLSPTITPTFTVTPTPSYTPTVSPTPTSTGTPQCSSIMVSTPTPPPTMQPTSLPPLNPTSVAAQNTLMFKKTIYNTNPDAAQVASVTMTYRDVRESPKNTILNTTIYPGKIATDVINITSRTVTFTSLYIPAGGSITFYVYYTNTNTHGGSTVTTLPSDFTSLSVSIVHTSACTK